MRIVGCFNEGFMADILRNDDGACPSHALFGNSPAHRDVRIMVTMPTEAADSYEFLSRLLEAGLNAMRICAMLNKDPNIVETVRFLNGILQRMESHYHKHRLIQALSVSVSRFLKRFG